MAALGCLLLSFFLASCADTLYREPSLENTPTRKEQDQRRHLKLALPERSPLLEASEEEFTTDEWPKVGVKINLNLPDYGIGDEKIPIDLLAVHHPKPYRFLSAIFTNLEDDNIEIEFETIRPLIRLKGKEVVPRKSDACSLSVLSSYLGNYLHDFQKGRPLVQAFDLENHLKGDLLEVRREGGYEWVEITPGQSIVVNWYYSHALYQTEPQLLLRGRLPPPTTCRSGLYDAFYKKCDGKLEYSFLSSCTGYTKIIAIDYASFVPFVIQYSVQRPKSINNESRVFFSLDLEGPSMIVP